jgi:hypothetical protein
LSYWKNQRQSYWPLPGIIPVIFTCGREVVCEPGFIHNNVDGERSFVWQAKGVLAHSVRGKMGV